MKKLFLIILRWKLGLLAKMTLRRYKPGIIGITGTVGKTSTKAAIAAVLSAERRVRSSSKSFNNELGLPLSILGDWESTEGLFFWCKAVFSSILQLIFKNKSYPELLVLEYGVDKPGDMKYLLNIARPHIGVVTALGDIPVHVEFFAGPEAVAKEKMKLVNQLPVNGFAILNADDEAVIEMKTQTRAHVITYGFSPESDMRISNFSNRFDGESGGINFKLTYGGSIVPIKLDGILGKAQSYSASIAATIGLIYGMNLVKISEAILGYKAPTGRLNLLPGIKGSAIIDDTYNSSPLAAHEALDVLKTLKAKRKIAVLGDMLELGKYTMEAHEEIGRIASKSADLIFAVGMRGKFIAEAATKGAFSRKKVFAFMSVNEAGVELQKIIQKGDLILIKGSQGVRMEHITKEVMAEPEKAKELLVRQSKAWLKTPGLYD